MRTTVSQYAKSLYGAIEGKSQKEIDVVIANFFKVLHKDGQMKMAEKIIEKFSEIWNHKNGIVEVGLVSSRKLEDSQVHKIGIFIKDRYDAEKVIFKDKVDKNIKGGIILRIGDDLIDASIERKLSDLRRNLTM